MKNHDISKIKNEKSIFHDHAEILIGNLGKLSYKTIVLKHRIYAMQLIANPMISDSNSMTHIFKT